MDDRVGIYWCSTHWDDFSSSVFCRVGSCGCPSSCLSRSTSCFATAYSPSVRAVILTRRSAHLSAHGCQLWQIKPPSVFVRTLLWSMPQEDQPEKGKSPNQNHAHEAQRPCILCLYPRWPREPFHFKKRLSTTPLVQRTSRKQFKSRCRSLSSLYCDIIELVTFFLNVPRWPSATHLFFCSRMSWIALFFCSSDEWADRIWAVWSCRVKACFLDRVQSVFAL